MVIRIPKKTTLFRVNYENTVIALAIVYFLETVYYVTLNPALEVGLKLIQFILLGYIGLIFCVQRVAVNSMVIRVTVIIVFALSFVFSGVLPFLKYGLVLLAGLNCNATSLYKKLMRLYIFLVATVILLSINDIIPSRIVRRGFSTYGFVHVNTLALYFFSILCCVIIINQHNFRWKHWIVSVLLIVGAWYMTDSRTTAITMVLTVCLVAIVRISPKLFQRGRVPYYFALSLPVVLFLLNVILGWNFNSDHEFLSKIDELLNGRLVLANTMIRTHRVTVFGQELVGYAVENAYVTGLVQFGLLPILAQIGIYIYAIRKSMREQSYGILVCLIAMAVHGMGEGATFNPYMNVALLTTFSRISYDRQGSR